MSNRTPHGLSVLALVTVLAACSSPAPTVDPPASPSSPAHTPGQSSVSAPPPASARASQGPPSGSPVPESQVDLPPPPEPTAPAPSTAGGLGSSSVPVPPGWRAVSDPGGVEKGYLGNGTPAHARDPRYAAYEMMAVGCAVVRRSSWTDPQHALEVSLARGAARGVADAMVFATPEQARAWFTLWQGQVSACRTGSDPRTAGTGTPTTWLGTRRFADGTVFRETAAVQGSTVRLYALADQPRALSDAQQRALLARISEPG